MNQIRRIVAKLHQQYLIKRAKRCDIKGHVLMLHNVDNKGGEFCISVDELKTLIKWLQNKKVISLGDWEKEDDFYALTIDDVPEGFFYNAFPVLRGARLPFTIFVNTSLLDKHGFITTRQLKEIAECEFCTVGSHGSHHEEFYKLSPKEAMRDLEDSKMKLEMITGKNVDMFAFPYGSYYACGWSRKYMVNRYYKYGFGTIKTHITSPKSILPYYFLPRINVDSKFIERLK